MHRLTLLLVLGGLVLAGCQDDRSLAPGDGPLAAISDGAHSGGNPDFFFLPPMVGDPSSDPNFDPGMFNGRLRPVLAVYTNFGDDCGGDLTYGPIAVPVAPDEEMYQLDWDTDAANLTAGTTYRLCVFSSLDGGTMLGFVDLLPVTGGMKNVRTEDTFAFQDGRVVPVTFRIEQGALSYDPSDPDALGTEFTVDDEGGVAVLADETQSLAAVAVPDGAVPEGTEITIVIAQEEPLYTETGTAECLPGGLLQSDWCYQIRTEPELYQFAEPVRVEICVDVSAIEEYADDLLVHKYNETEGLVELPWAEPTLIGSDCSGMGQYGAAPGFFGRLSQWARRLLAPPDLLANVLISVPKGLGGTGGSFSDFGGAVPLAALPDLEVSELTLHTPAVLPGNAISYTYTISNVGNEGPEGNSTFDAATYLSTDAVLDPADVELGGGYSAWSYHLSVGWSASVTESDVVIPTSVPPGTYYVIVVADAKPGLPPNNYPGVIESDESNNARAVPLLVTTIRIDGVLSEGEWGAVNPILVEDAGEYAGTSVYVTNDAGFLYFALRVPQPTAVEDDKFLVRFDNANNGVFDLNEDQICAATPPYTFFDCHSYLSGEDLSWSGLDERQDGISAVTSADGWKTFEVARPLASGDSFDFSLTYGGTIGFCAAYYTGNIYVSYPASCIYVGNDLSSYAKLVIAQP